MKCYIIRMLSTLLSFLPAIRVLCMLIYLPICLLPRIYSSEESFVYSSKSRSCVLVVSKKRRRKNHTHKHTHTPHKQKNRHTESKLKMEQNGKILKLYNITYRTQCSIYSGNEENIVCLECIWCVDVQWYAGLYFAWI